MRKYIRRGLAICFSLAVAATISGVMASPAQAAPKHIYIQVGGTGTAAPRCADNYGFANQHINGAQVVTVCYPASFGPFLDGYYQPGPNAIFAPSYGASVNEGVNNLKGAIETTYRENPGAHLTIVGYSQGADIADRVLEELSHGNPYHGSQIDGMLYADPRQPGTGLWRFIPAGTELPGVGISPGTGPEDFGNIKVQRFCIRTDGVCDASSLQGIGGFVIQHGKYPQDGGVMVQTLGSPGGTGTVWFREDGSRE